MIRFERLAVAAAVVVLACGAPALAAGPFEVSYLDGSQWSSIYAQGFSPSVEPSPNPGLGAGDTVYLQRFEFMKSGNADASNLRLAILSNIFADLTGLSTSHWAFVGLSTNTVATTAGIGVGDPIEFQFGGLPLTYGSNYAAVLVTLGGDNTTLTPTLAPVQTADYVETPPGSGTWIPESNYGGTDVYEYAVSNFISVNEFGSFFNTFSYGADANFRAVFAIPEPTALGLMLCGVVVVVSRRQWGRR